MTSSLQADAFTPLVLHAETAQEIMTPNPVSVRNDASVSEVIRLLTDKGLSAVPVIDAAGRAVGVVSRGDVVAHDRERVAPLPPASAATQGRGPGTDPAQARDLMTPVVFSVGPDAPAGQIVAEMVAMKVNRLFVVDPAGIIVGVITALDVLRHLRPADRETAAAP